MTLMPVALTYKRLHVARNIPAANIMQLGQWKSHLLSDVSMLNFIHQCSFTTSESRASAGGVFTVRLTK